jgi:hypothetical protein
VKIETTYAFLIKLAARQLVPDRLGILQLLAAIAAGRSYRDVHGNLLNEPDFANRKALELRSVEEAHVAVARGIASFLAMTREETDVRLAAAHVLALLPKHRELVCVRLRSMERAGLLLLLGLAGDRSEATLSVLTGALLGDDLMQRRSSALAFAYLKPDRLPDLARRPFWMRSRRMTWRTALMASPGTSSPRSPQRNSIRASIPDPAGRRP